MPLFAQAETDRFTVPHDYLLQGTADTTFDGWSGPTDRSRSPQINSSIMRSGQLYLGSTETRWSNSVVDRGPYLYRQVTGDFKVTVEVTDFIGTPDVPVVSNVGGLMLRPDWGEAPGIQPTWLALDYAPSRGGNVLRYAAEGHVRDLYNNGRTWSLDRFLQLERQGVELIARTSHDGIQWESLWRAPEAEVFPNDGSMQVGLYHACQTTRGYIAFDNFTVELTPSEGPVPNPTASQPRPEDGADDAHLAVLQWQAGTDAQWHHLYLGTSPETLERIAERLPVHVTQFQPVEPFDKQTVYYWRVDEEDAVGVVHTGPIWSFMQAPDSAHAPWPPDQSQGLPTSPILLSWRSGSRAVWHEIFIGRQAQDVAVDTASTSQGRQLQTTFEFDHLVPDVTYYWRVDEIEADGVTRHSGQVWLFTTQAYDNTIDPNLVAWWPCDLGSGSLLRDFSGHGNHGQLYGSPAWVDGVQGHALAFDGLDDSALCPVRDMPQGSHDFSIACWVFPERHHNTLVWWGLPKNDRACQLRLLEGTRCRFGFWNNNIDFESGGLEGEWHHLVATYNDGARACYLGGLSIPEISAKFLTEAPDIALTDVAIGFNPHFESEAYAGRMDDIRIYNKALIAEEILSIMAGQPYFAAQPIPISGSTVTPESAAVLQWTAGTQAVGHDVYWGRDATRVRQATISESPGVMWAWVVEPRYRLLQTLEIGQSYYWRVDETHADGRITRGTVWTFTVSPINVIEDFEQYTDDKPNRIFDTWLDGNVDTQSGSTIGHLNEPFAERTIVHGGEQAMPLLYDNRSSFTVSYATLSLRTPHNWTVDGMDTLVLYMYGQTDNLLFSQDRLWLRLRDRDSRTTTTLYPGPLGDLTRAHWHEWLIPLATLDTIDLTAITQLRIGMGQANSETPGGRGEIYFDDIQLEIRNKY
ncbi:LamG-like jellyroll fold domain-containing protein [Planctomycetota bacterium]